MDTSDIRDLVDDAKRRGLDVVEMLDRRGLLVTTERYQGIFEVAATHLSDAIDLATPTQLGGGKVPTTAGDMKQGIVAFIRRHYSGEHRNGQ